MRPLNILQYAEGGLTIATTSRIEQLTPPLFQDMSTSKPTLKIRTASARIKCTAAPSGTSGLTLAGVELLAMVTNNLGVTFEIELPINAIALPVNVLLNQITAWWSLNREVSLSIGDNLAGAGMSGRIATVALKAAATLENTSPVNATFELETQAQYDVAA